MRILLGTINLTCEACGNPFPRRRSYHNHIVEKRGITRTFCSLACKNESERRADYSGIAERYSAGESIQSIAKSLGVTFAAMRNQLLRLGVQFRGRGDHLSGDRNPTKGKGHTEAAKAKIRAANLRQFSDPLARERHAVLTCKQIAEGRTGKAYNRLEGRVAAMFDAQNIGYTQQFRVGRFVFDFYLPDTNTLTEVHGTFWHADPRHYSPDCLSPIQLRNVENDRRKAERASKDGYSLRVIWEADVP